MKSPAYNEAMEYAIQVLKAIMDSGYEMDYPLEQFVNVSIRIGACLARADVPIDQEEMLEAYKEANRNAYKSIYWSEILGHIENYEGIPFESLRKKCESLHEMLRDGVKMIENLIGKHNL